VNCYPNHTCYAPLFAQINNLSSHTQFCVLHNYNHRNIPQSVHVSQLLWLGLYMLNVKLYAQMHPSTPTERTTCVHGHHMHTHTHADTETDSKHKH
jgi:hypothetical protein